MILSWHYADAELLKKLEALTEEERQRVFDYIEFLPERERQKEAREKTVKGGRMPGLAKGRIEVSNDLDEPLDDFKPYME